jgi:hypothetical protein
MSALEQINQQNHNKYNYDDANAFPVKAGFWNALITLLSTVLTEAGAFLVDTISEKTSGEGVTVDGVVLKDGRVGDVMAVTATSGGTGTAEIREAQVHVVITSTNVDHIASLPKLANIPTGIQISGSFVNTGCELRPHIDDQVTAVTVNGVSATGGTEMAYDNSTAGALFEAIKTSSTSWIVKSYSKTGAYRAIIPD